MTVSNLTGAQAQRELSHKRLGAPGIAASISVNRFERDEAKLRTSLSGYISHLILILRGVRDFSERGVSNSACGNIQSSQWQFTYKTVSVKRKIAAKCLYC